MADFYILITDAGAALEAAAHAAGEPLVLTAFGVCDGGAAFTPDPTLTALANEEYRGDISSLAVSEDDPTVLVAQCIVPASSGGYTIRGIGIYAGDTLYAVGNYPDQPKPAPDTGYAASLEILAQLAVSDTADVTLNVTDGAWLTKAEGDQLYVPLQRKINGHDLTADLTLTPEDVDAVPSGRTVNGHPLTADVVVTAQDIFSNPIKLVEGWDLNGLLTPGLYVQEFNAGAANSANYPVALAGTLIVTKNAGVSQVYIEYATGTTYVRTYYGESWSAWRRLAFSDNETFTGNLTVSGAVFSQAADGFRLVHANYGAFWRNDGVRMYLMLTNAGDPYGTWNNFRPFIVDLDTGNVTLGGNVVIDTPHFNNWTYIDDRYYTKTEVNSTFATSAWVSQHFITGVRLSASVQIHPLTLNGAGAGYVVAAADFNEHNSPKDVIVLLKAIQVAINGTWVTIEG